MPKAVVRPRIHEHFMTEFPPPHADDRSGEAQKGTWERTYRSGHNSPCPSISTLKSRRRRDGKGCQEWATPESTGLEPFHSEMRDRTLGTSQCRFSDV